MLPEFSSLQPPNYVATAEKRAAANKPDLFARLEASLVASEQKKPSFKDRVTAEAETLQRLLIAFGASSATAAALIRLL
ncbi:MAG: hypothetical protein M3Q81_00440 [bacterium]|nr:hypothetical protein [bacterium]